ncbi:MAG TPA: tripartite tricarboxylate transporter substrate-binding protein, partial [Usitatibacter sp.]|nr:tripartite tricarboxylate transporter substrate-binding protein [Usitatibacter sp.]
MIRRVVVTAAALAALVPFAAAAQQWPARPVTVVVPFSPGTGMDILARTIGPRLTAMWGQPVVVENKPGASGNIGTNFVAKAPADGYTLMMGASTVVTNNALYKDMPYNPLTDLAPIGMAAKASMLLVVHRNTGIASVRELVEKSHAKPGTFNYGSPGIGTPHHLAMEMFKARSGADITHIPFSATGPAVTQLLGGQVPI